MNSINLEKDKKRFNSMGKITKYKYNNYFEKNNSFIFCPKNQDLINYYDRKNKNIINNISINFHKKQSNSKYLTTKDYSKINYDKDQNPAKKITIVPKRRKNKINKSSSLPIYLKKNIKQKSNNLSNNNINDIDNNNSILHNSNIFNLKNIANFKNNLIKYIENKKIEKDNFHKLYNNSNNDSEILNFNKTINAQSKQYFIKPNYFIKTKEKKIDNDTLEIISKECEKVKSSLESKYIKKEKEFKKRMLSQKLKQKHKICDIDMKKYFYKSKNKNNTIVEDQIELIKKKINNNNFPNCKNIELKNSFRSKLFLYISNPYEQLFNTRLYGKLIDDEDFLKELHNSENIEI